MATAQRSRSTGPKSGPAIVVGTRVSPSAPVPADRDLRFDCQVRGHADGQKVFVNVFGYDKDRDLTFQSSTLLDLVKAGKWTKLTRKYVVPPGTTTMTAWVINMTARPISVSDAHLRVGGPKKAGPRLPKPPGGLLARLLRPPPARPAPPHSRRAGRHPRRCPGRRRHPQRR